MGAYVCVCFVYDCLCLPVCVFVCWRVWVLGSFVWLHVWVLAWIRVCARVLARVCA